MGFPASATARRFTHETSASGPSWRTSLSWSHSSRSSPRASRPETRRMRLEKRHRRRRRGHRSRDSISRMSLSFRTSSRRRGIAPSPRMDARRWCDSSSVTIVDAEACRLGSARRPLRERRRLESERHVASASGASASNASCARYTSSASASASSPEDAPAPIDADASSRAVSVRPAAGGDIATIRPDPRGARAWEVEKRLRRGESCCRRFQVEARPRRIPLRIIPHGATSCHPTGGNQGEHSVTIKRKKRGDIFAPGGANKRSNTSTEIGVVAVGPPLWSSHASSSPRVPRARSFKLVQY